MKMTLFCRLNAMLSAYQKAMKLRVTIVGASLGPVTLATALQTSSRGRQGQPSQHRT